ncbi:fumarylacetoacetate (FAA) hydrolase [Paraburkholderia sp. GV068]|uniref:fumarylacetoacetate hydrolase family protein n=1 Tax=Paraburkholderia TaxID=1822464 RepID=UPI000D3002ED|nr:MULTISPECIES: fumarylacetoacetate hydrolase family protein [unclassified Paraburkholderia]PTQ93049.1 fumarylacetoacetate (FAA) hydrolase [Paraburkholderia sp. GV072]PUA99780.1 fumarylacetoacetate (FAA) hydrolase [Paraburkholderia sp. GV068]
MKLATLKNGTRDGQLVVVSRDLSSYVLASDLAPTMQALLDHWASLEAALQERYDALNRGDHPGIMPFVFERAEAPLPRAFQWCDGSAYLSHAELVRKARKAEMPSFLYHDPLMYQGASDTFIGPRDDIVIADATWGIDLEAEIAVVTDDVPMGVRRADAVKHIKLIMLVNDVSLRNLMPHELSKGFGFFHSKPSTAFSGVAVTPDELGTHWDGAKLNLRVTSHINGKLLGQPHAGIDLDFDFPTLLEHAAKTRSLSAGTVIGSGTVSNRDPGAGSSCLQERRMLEIIAGGEPSTPFLSFGDEVRIEVLDPSGASVFGAIQQKVRQYAGPTQSSQAEEPV